MSCIICDKPVSRYNKGEAEICYSCRNSYELVPVWLHRLESGDVHFSLDEKPDSEVEPVVETLQGELAKRDVAMLRDIEHRASYSGNPDDEQLATMIWDTIPVMVAKALIKA